MKQFYLERLWWIFHYTRKDFGYCLLKTLCIVIGLPIYAVGFVVEMALTLVNLIFSWVPILNVVVMLICKVLMFLFDKPFYICILPDIKAYISATHHVPEYEDVTPNADVPSEQPLVAATDDEPQE